MAAVSPVPGSGLRRARRRGRRAGRARRPRRRPAAELPPGHARGAAGEVQPRAARGASRSRMRWPPPPPRCGAASPFDGVVGRARLRHGLAACGWRCAASRRARPDRRLLQRQPALDRGGAAVAGRAARRARRWPCSGSWPSSVRRPRPSTGDGRAGRGARDRGRRATRPTSTARRRSTASTRPSRCCVTARARDAALVKGSRVARLEDVVARLRDGAGDSVAGGRSDSAAPPSRTSRRRGPVG